MKTVTLDEETGASPYPRRVLARKSPSRVDNACRKVAMGGGIYRVKAVGKDRNCNAVAIKTAFVCRSIAALGKAAYDNEPPFGTPKC